MEVSDEAKALQETAKAFTKGLDTSEKLGGFIANLIGGSLEQAMGIWEDKLRYRRWENQLRLMDRAQEELSRRGLYEPTRAIPLQFAVPLLEAAALEEDDYLRKFWASMLANAADASVEFQMRTAFISILEDLTSLDVQILDTVYRAEGGWPIASSFYEGFATGFLPGKAAFSDQFEKVPKASEEVEIAVGNLIRLGLLTQTESLDGGREHNFVSKTALGRAFHRSCSSDGHQKAER